MTRRVEFWSSTEYATFLPALVGQLQNHEVTARQCFQVRQVDYWNSRRWIERLFLRFRCYALYPLRVGLRFIRGRGLSAGVVCTNTFFAPWIAVRVAGRGTPVVNWVFDLFPEVLVVAGKLKSGSIGERMLASLVRSTFHHAAANVFLGERLLAYAEMRFGKIPRAFVIPVGADAAPFRHQSPGKRDERVPPKVLYCGNFGRMHDVETVACVIRSGLPEGIEMEFCGNGAGYRALEAAIAATDDKRVALGGNLEGDAWIEKMLSAEVALVTLRRGAEGLVLPSKTYSAMAAGQAVLAVCPTNSDLADTVRKLDAGWVVEPGDAEGLRSALRQIATEPEAVFRCRQNAFNAGQGLYDQKAIAGQWTDLFDQIERETSKGR